MWICEWVWFMISLGSMFLYSVRNTLLIVLLSDELNHNWINLSAGSMLSAGMILIWNNTRRLSSCWQCLGSSKVLKVYERFKKRGLVYEFTFLNLKMALCGCRSFYKKRISANKMVTKSFCGPHVFHFTQCRKSTWYGVCLSFKASY